MARTPNGTPPRKTPIPLTLVDQGGDEDAEDEVFIVYGEAGEDLAFEICEDLEIALEVRDSMLEDGFKVRARPRRQRRLNTAAPQYADAERLACMIRGVWACRHASSAPP